MSERGAGSVGLSVGLQSKAELDVVCRMFRSEMNGQPEVANGLSGRGIGQATVDKTDQKAFACSQCRDLVMPAAENMVSVVIFWIHRDCALSEVPHQTGTFDLFASAGEQRELAVAYGDRGEVDGTSRIERGGAGGECERLRAELFLQLGTRGVFGQVRELSGDLLENERISRTSGVGAAVKFERRGGIEAGFGGERGAK